ncbi:MAG: exodeoxyribonuclease [Candidatus Cloacimonadota bacterium]|nr:exodeoxyribonuclease [Candidatus Cloacimonadota bacterium]
MEIYSWNVNGLRAAVRKNFLEFIEDEDPDILAIQETKLQEEQIPEEVKNLSQYHQYWNFAEKRGYSGVAVFTKQKPEKVEYTIGDADYDAEGRLLILYFSDFVLLNCYFPNGKMSEERLQYKLNYYDKMFNLMQKLRKAGHNVVVCGDYNTAHKEIDLANPERNKDISGFLPIERKWLDKLVNNDWVDTFRQFNQQPGQYSWWTYRFGARKRNAGWRIDYFFVNKDFMNRVKDAFIRQDIMGSDHCPIGVELG